MTGSGLTSGLNKPPGGDHGTAATIEILPVTGLPEFRPGDDLSAAVALGSLINSGTARTATPSMSARSPSWISQQSRIPVARRAP